MKALVWGKAPFNQEIDPTQYDIIIGCNNLSYLPVKPDIVAIGYPQRLPSQKTWFCYPPWANRWEFYQSSRGGPTREGLREIYNKYKLGQWPILSTGLTAILWCEKLGWNVDWVGISGWTSAEPGVYNKWHSRAVETYILKDLKNKLEPNCEKI